MKTNVGLIGVSGIAVIAAMASPALADCTPDTGEAADLLVENWRDLSPAAAPTIADPAHAICVQNAVVAELQGDLGERSGWKVGLTSAAAQQNFGVDQPVAGQLLAHMMVEEGATVARGFGARPIAEADLIVTVADPAIMDASTPMEALDHLESFIPFIELADLMVAEGEPLSGDIITAINVGARSGVMGTPVALEADDTTFGALASMTVRIEDGGELVAEIPGAAILGHPLNAVVWLVNHLADRGETLAAGDMISLGSFGAPMPPGDLDQLTVTYTGLPFDTDPSVSVRFE